VHQHEEGSFYRGGYEQSVIKNEIFYKENVYKLFPNPKLGTKDKKKLLEVSLEKEGYVIYIIIPKYYILKGSKRNDNQIIPFC
jgi:hypothetical protein